MTKGKSKVIQSASDKRRFPRYELSTIKVRIDGKDHELIDVSSEGLFVGGVEGVWEGETPIELTLRVPLMNKISPLLVEGVVIRQTDRGLAIQYRSPNRTWPQVLRVISIKEEKEEEAG